VLANGRVSQKGFRAVVYGMKNYAGTGLLLGSEAHDELKLVTDHGAHQKKVINTQGEIIEFPFHTQSAEGVAKNTLVEPVGVGQSNELVDVALQHELRSKTGAAGLALLVQGEQAEAAADDRLTPTNPSTDIVAGIVEVVGTEDGRAIWGVIWQELKLESNTMLAKDKDLRRQAKILIREVAAAFHKPDPLLRPVLGNDGQAIQVRIHTTDDEPISGRMYRVSPDRLTAMKEKLDEMLAQGVVCESNSSWSSPVVFVPKTTPAGAKPKWRCTIDLRALNAKTVSFAYPTPHIDDLLHACGQAEAVDGLYAKAVGPTTKREINGITYIGPHRPCVWGHFDFFESFHELCVHPADRHKLAFSSPTHGLLEYMRLPMGWKNSPGILQKVIQDILRSRYDGKGRFHNKPALNNFAWNYIDDVVIVAANTTEATHLYRWLLTKFAERNLTVRASKSGLYLAQIAFLGHIVNEHGCQPSSEKCKAIREMPPPTDVRGIRRVLGMAGYYRRYYPKPFAVKTAALSELLKADNKFKWGVEEQEAFDYVRHGLADYVMMSFPRWGQRFTLRTDASKVGFAAVLTQKNPKSRLREIIYAISRKTIGPERHYDPRELEVACAVWACQKLRPWLIHRNFDLESDHANTKWILQYGLDQHNSKFVRWATQLSEFDFQFIWKSGVSMIEPDTLSRAPLEAEADEPAPFQVPVQTNLRRACENFLQAPEPESNPACNRQINFVPWDAPAEASHPTHPRAAVRSTVLCDSSALQRSSVHRRAEGGAPRVFILAHGISTDAMAAEELDIKVVGGSEDDELLAKAFEERTGARSYPKIETLIDKIREGEFPELQNLEIMSSGVPCPYRSRAGELSNNRQKKRRENGTHRHLFLKQVELYELCRPDIIVIEHPPPSQHNLKDYLKLEERLQAMNYNTQTNTLNCAEHGDDTSRRRWFLVANQLGGWIEWPVAKTNYPGLTDILNPAKSVPPAQRVPPEWNKKWLKRLPRWKKKPPPFVAHQTAYYISKTGEHNLKGLRVYDRRFPLPSSTTKGDFIGGPCCLIEDKLGPRQVQPEEVARGHGFTEPALAQLREQPKHIQWKWVANSTPRRTIQSVLSAALVLLKTPTALHKEGPISEAIRQHNQLVLPSERGTLLEAPTERQAVVRAQALVHALPTLDGIRALQQTDEEVKRLVKWVKQGRDPKTKADLPAEWHKHANYLRLYDELLWYRPVLDQTGDAIDVVVIPTALRQVILRAYHYDKTTAHPARNALFALIRVRFFWLQLRKDCAALVNACDACCRAKATKRTSAGMTQPMLFEKPFDRLSIDLVGKLTPTSAKNQWILTIIDAFTNYVQFIALPNKAADTVVQAFYKHVICVHGAPKVVLSDNGGEFTADVFERLCCDYGVKHQTTSAYTPSTNGQCERVHRYLGAILKIAVRKWGDEWDECLPQAAFSYNITPLSYGPYSPFYLMHLFEPNLPQDLKCLQSTEPMHARKFPTVDEYVADLKPIQKMIHHSIMSARREAAVKRKLEGDLRKVEVTYEQGDMVVVWRPISSKHLSGKLLYQNVGPFEVLGQPHADKAGGPNPAVYRLRHLETGKECTQNIRHMFPYLRGTKASQVSEETKAEWATASPAAVNDEDNIVAITDLEEGDFLWLRARGKQRGLLTRIKSVDPHSDLVEVHTYNTHTAARKGGWCPVWYVGDDQKYEEYWDPKGHLKVKKGYQKYILVHPFKDFIPVALAPGDLKEDGKNQLEIPFSFHSRFCKPKSKGKVGSVTPKADPTYRTRIAIIHWLNGHGEKAWMLPRLAGLSDPSGF
jgi:site-specific DNA-cytosine methylase